MSDSHTAYMKYLVDNFERVYKYRLLPEEVTALANCHKELAGWDESTTGVGATYRSFVEFFNETNALEPHLSQMLEDMKVIWGNVSDSRFIDDISRDLIKAGWRKLNADEL